MPSMVSGHGPVSQRQRTRLITVKFPVQVRAGPPGPKAEPIFSPSYEKGESAMIEGPVEEINDPYYIEPHHTSDFLCIRLDRIQWYTSGFQ